MKHQISKKDFANHKIENILAYDGESNKKLLVRININKNSFKYFIEQNGLVVDDSLDLDSAISIYNNM